MKEEKRIRPKGTIAVSEVGTAHMPKEIREELGIQRGDIAYVVDAKTAVLFSPNSSPKDIIKSLEILIQDLKLRIEDCKNEKTTNTKTT